MQWIWGFLILGVTVRVVRYLLRFPLWGDETLLAVNFLDRGYLDLLRPLDRNQIAPLLYLWVQRTVINIFGFSEYSLRAYVFLCGIGSLLLFRHLAGRLLRGTALVMAVGTFAVAYPLIRYSAEAKPYGSDMFVSLVLLTLIVEWCRRPQQRRWWWALTLAMPVAILLSYPAMFVAGGVSCAMATVLWKRGSRRDWLRWAVLNAAIAAGVAALVGGTISSQMAGSGRSQQVAFAESFPPLDSPGKLLGWLVEAQTGDMFSYPMGSGNGASALTTVCCATALVLLIRRRRYWLAVLATMPLALHLAAAALQRYPYGCHMRFGLYLGPVTCLLMGLGMSIIVRPHWMWWPGRVRAAVFPPGGASFYRDAFHVRATVVVLLALGLIGAGSILRDVRMRAKDEVDLRGQGFADWFWGTLSRDHELVCIKTDLGKAFPPAGVDWEFCISPKYLCNQRIYSPRLARGEKARLDRVSHERPLACVQYWRHDHPYDQTAFAAWLNEMKSKYDLISCRQYPLQTDNDAGSASALDRVEVYEFVPKPQGTASSE